MKHANPAVSNIITIPDIIDYPYIESTFHKSKLELDHHISIAQVPYKFIGPIHIMKHNSTDNKYKEGTEVYATENPSEKLIIRRYIDRIYYCKIKLDPSLKEVVYFERELQSSSTPT